MTKDSSYISVRFFFRKNKYCSIDFELSYLTEFYDLGRDKIYTVFKYLLLLFDVISVSCARFTVFTNKIVEKKKKMSEEIQRWRRRSEEEEAGLGLILLESIASLLHTCNVFESVYRYSWFQRVVLDEPKDSLADVYVSFVSVTFVAIVRSYGSRF